MAIKREDIERAITPMGDRLFVKTFAPPEEMVTKGGVIVAQRAIQREVETLIRAQIVKVGSECGDGFKPGQFILYPRFSGIEVSTSDLGDATISYNLLSKDAVCAVVEEGYARAELGLDEPRTVAGGRKTRIAATG